MKILKNIFSRRISLLWRFLHHLFSARSRLIMQALQLFDQQLAGFFLVSQPSQSAWSPQLALRWICPAFFQCGDHWWLGKHHLKLKMESQQNQDQCWHLSEDLSSGSYDLPRRSYPRYLLSPTHPARVSCFGTPDRPGSACVLFSFFLWLHLFGLNWLRSLIWSSQPWVLSARLTLFAKLFPLPCCTFLARWLSSSCIS